ncbi:MAG TPA: lycopene cyclase domain-containing protein [Chloroflexota bacterium]|nr:lycopene cyclase domain-containing protein [Chloroflexota bacterium]
MFGHATYLTLELVWAAPVLIVQWAAGNRILWTCRVRVALAILVPTIYLSCADAVALANGIWLLHRNRILGFMIGNVPVEETIFFLLTNAMVVQTIALAANHPAFGVLRPRTTRAPDNETGV